MDDPGTLYMKVTGNMVKQYNQRTILIFDPFRMLINSGCDSPSDAAKGIELSRI